MHSNPSSLRRTFSTARRAFAAPGALLAAWLALGCGGEGGGAPAAEPGAWQKAVRAVGGAAALDAVRTLSFEGRGTSLVVDEGFAAGEPSRPVSEYHVAVDVDLDGDGLSVAYERESLAMVPGAKTAYREIAAGDRGYLLGNELVFGAAPDYVGAPMSPARRAAMRQEQRLLNPTLLLRGLGEGDVRDAGLRVLGGRPHHQLVIAGPAGAHELTLLVDATTGLIGGLSTLESDPLRGDVVLEAAYEGWAFSGGLAWPRRVALSLGGQPVRVEERTRVEVNPELDPGRFSLPADAGGGGEHDGAHADEGERSAQHYQRFAALGTAPFFDWPNTTVVGVELGAGSGLYHLVGAGHHSLLVDQGESAVLVEAPLHAARSRAILAWVDQHLAGGLERHPISHVIATHHHADHSAGLRTFVERGARVVAAASSQAFLAEAFAAPRTLDPDAGPAGPAAAPAFDAVAPGGAFRVGDVTAYQIASAHADDMLIVHVRRPDAPGFVFNSDLYLPDRVGIVPGSIFVQGGRDLAAALDRLGLASSTLALLGGHGNVDASTGGHFTVSYADFRAQLEAATAR